MTDEEMAIASLVGRSLAEMERDFILATLRQYGGNRVATARVLRITPRGLRYKIELYRAQGYDIPASPFSGRPSSAWDAIFKRSR